MISKIGIMISTLFVLAGFFGVGEKTVGKKMFYLSISSIGVTALSFVQMTAYGIMGGFFQIIFRFLGLALFITLLCAICKKNDITEMSDVCGIGRGMPYAFLALTIFAMMVIGVPMTGTFSGILYSEIGLLGDGFGAFVYVGMIGNMLGVAVPAALIFPILKQAYFPDGDVPEKRKIGRLHKGSTLFYLCAAVVLMVLCVYQKPVLTASQNLMEMILD